MSSDRDPFVLHTEHFTIEGRSYAGHETWFRIRELGIALDIGRCPDAVVPMSHVFISHAHLDHAAGIPWYAGQRHLQRLDPGTVYVPSEAAEDFRELMRIQGKLTGSSMELNVRGLKVGEEFQFSRTYMVRAHAASHRVAARAWEFLEIRHRLLPGLEGRSRDEILALRREGQPVDERYVRPILFYTGDTDRGILESGGAIYRSEVLMIECSFIADGHQERAAKYRHIHLDDIAEFADSFENELIVLTHFSRRYPHEDIRAAVRRRLPRTLQERVRLAV